jgi:hypothetical protein
LSLHCIALHLSPRKPLRIIIDIIQIILIFAVPRDRTSKCSIQVLLVCCSAPEAFLPKQVSEGLGVVVGVDAEEFTSFGVTGFELG